MEESVVFQSGQAASVAGTGLGVSTATAAGLSHLVVDAGVAQPVQGARSVRIRGERGDLRHAFFSPR